MSTERRSPKAPHLWAQKGAARPAGLTGSWPQPVIEAEDFDSTAPDEPAPSAEAEPEAVPTDGEPDELPPAASLLTARRWWTDRAGMETVSSLAPPEHPVQVEAEATKPVEHETADAPSEGTVEAAPAEQPATMETPAPERAQAEPPRLSDRAAWLPAALVASVVVAVAAGVAGWYWLRPAPQPAVEQADETAASSAGSGQAATVESAAVEDRAPPKPPVKSGTESVDEAAASPSEPPSSSPGTGDLPPDGIAARVPPPAPDSAPVTAADGTVEPTAQTTAAPAEKPAYTVQLASVREAAAVEQEWARLQAALPDVLAGREYRVDRASLEQVGEVFRLRIGAFRGYSEARALCERIRARGQSCLVVPR